MQLEETDVETHHALQKRKRDGAQAEHVDTSKPTAVFRPTIGREHTLSIALPGSIIAK